MEGMSLAQRIVDSGFDNYGFNYNMPNDQIIKSSTKILFDHFISKGEKLFEARRLSNLVMSNQSLPEDILIEMKFRKYRGNYNE